MYKHKLYEKYAALSIHAFYLSFCVCIYFTVQLANFWLFLVQGSNSGGVCKTHIRLKYSEWTLRLFCVVSVQLHSGGTEVTVTGSQLDSVTETRVTLTVVVTRLTNKTTTSSTSSEVMLILIIHKRDFVLKQSEINLAGPFYAAILRFLMV